MWEVESWHRERRGAIAAAVRMRFPSVLTRRQSYYWAYEVFLCVLGTYCELVLLRWLRTRQCRGDGPLAAAF